MKRAGTTILAVLMLATVLAGGATRAGGATPLKVGLFDPFYPLVERHLEPRRPVGSIVEGCTLTPGTRCPGVELASGGKTLEQWGADLSASNLRRAGLRSSYDGASFAAADLTGADLNGTEAAALTAPFARFAKADAAGLSAMLGRLAGAHFRGGAELYESSFFAADLAGADLRGTDLGEELAGAVLSGADLRGANLRHARLQFADLTHAKLSPGALRTADLCDTVLPNGQVANPRKRCELPALYIGVGEPEPTISPSDPRYSLLIHAAGTWRGPHREKCGEFCPEGGQWLTHLRGPSFAYENLQRTHRFAGKVQALVNLTGAGLQHADLAGAVIPGAAASFANLSDADLEGADLTYAEVAAAALARANLSGADARDADFTRADLFDADLSDARLGATSLVEADLHGADFSGTDLSGADLFRAELDPDALAGATLCETVLPDGTVASPGPACEHR
jgi:uncharacterized protein YjbI with pentapeptide repeats